jgi:hypothetical protein
MKPHLNKKLVIAATAVTLLGGAAVAVAGTRSSSGSGEQAYLNDLAGRLGVSTTALSGAIKAADSDQLNAAVAAGRLTQAQADKLEQRIAQSAGAPPVGGALRHGFGAGRRRGGLGDGAAAALGYLGIAKATLRADLSAGESLDAIANASAGKSAAGLKAAILAAEATRLNNAVNAGTITSQQESQRLTDITSRIDAILQRTWKGGGRSGGWARRGATGSAGSPLFGS